MQCIFCNVPLTYYINAGHASRQSCRQSQSGYHEFQSNGCFNKLYAFLFPRKTESRESLLKHREQRRNTV